MSNEVTKKEELDIKSAWGNIGVTVKNANVSLQLQATELIKKLIPPATIADIPKAEEILSEVKSGLQKIIKDRKDITSKFDKVASNLMLHEKSLMGPIDAMSKAIIDLKRQEEARIRAEQDKAAKIAEIKEKCLQAINIAYDQFYKEMDEKILAAYTHALDKKVKAIDLYVSKLKGFLTAENFTMKINSGSEESIAIWKECVASSGKPTPEQMLSEYHNRCDQKFAKFASDLQNAEASIAKAQEDAKEAEAKRKQELDNANIAATLETKSEVTIVQSDIKELKKKMVLDMEDGPISAMIIIAAFSANFNKASKFVRVKSWMNLTVDQMGAALAGMKNEDERISFTGVVFKIEERL